MFRMLFFSGIHKIDNNDAFVIFCTSNPDGKMVWQCLVIVVLRSSMPNSSSKRVLLKFLHEFLLIVSDIADEILSTFLSSCEIEYITEDIDQPRSELNSSEWKLIR